MRRTTLGPSRRGIRLGAVANRDRSADTLQQRGHPMLARMAFLKALNRTVVIPFDPARRSIIRPSGCSSETSDHREHCTASLTFVIFPEETRMAYLVDHSPVRG